MNNRIKNHARRAVREREDSELKKVQDLKPKQMKAYWDLLKEIGNINPKSGAVPTMAVDSSGVEHSDPEGVRDVWFETWSGMAKYQPHDPRYDEQHRSDVQATVAEVECIEQEEPRGVPLTPSQTIAAEALNGEIEMVEVQNSVISLSNGKAPGSDGIVSEILKKGRLSMIRCLHSLCSLMFRQGKVPLDWLRGVIVPIHKDGNKKEPLNYRPITLLSIAGKVYTGILQARLMKWCETNNIIVAEQGGFRPGRGCPEQLYTLTELIKLRRRRKEMTYACFIDIRKAYYTGKNYCPVCISLSATRLLCRAKVISIHRHSRSSTECMHKC